MVKHSKAELNEEACKKIVSGFNKIKLNIANTEEPVIFHYLGDHVIYNKSGELFSTGISIRNRGSVAIHVCKPTSLFMKMMTLFMECGMINKNDITFHYPIDLSSGLVSKKFNSSLIAYVSIYDQLFKGNGLAGTVLSSMYDQAGNLDRKICKNCYYEIDQKVSKSINLMNASSKLNQGGAKIWVW